MLKIMEVERQYKNPAVTLSDFTAHLLYNLHSKVLREGAEKDMPLLEETSFRIILESELLVDGACTKIWETNHSLGESCQQQEKLSPVDSAHGVGKLEI